MSLGSLSLACSECKRRNYSSARCKKKATERLQLKKYCPFCRMHVLHKESK